MTRHPIIDRIWKFLMENTSPPGGAYMSRLDAILLAALCFLMPIASAMALGLAG
jgi:hypothetical protein